MNIKAISATYKVEVELVVVNGVTADVFVFVGGGGSDHYEFM